MRPSRIVVVMWSSLIVVLLLIELAEITHFFTISVQSAIEDPLAFVFALVFTTILALVGAIFIGIYVSSRMLNPSGFTPFEEEMLMMRREVRDLQRSVDQIRKDLSPGAPPPARTGQPEEEDDP